MVVGVTVDLIVIAHLDVGVDVDVGGRVFGTIRRLPHDTTTRTPAPGPGFPPPPPPLLMPMSRS